MIHPECLDRISRSPEEGCDVCTLDGYCQLYKTKCIYSTEEKEDTDKEGSS